MNFNIIDMNQWERAECYKHFSTIAKSTYSITVDVDITELFHYTREHNLRLFPTFTWVVTTAINKQEEFRMGFDEEGNLGIWDEIYPDYSVLDEKTKIMNSLCHHMINPLLPFINRCVRIRMTTNIVKKKRVDILIFL